MFYRPLENITAYGNILAGLAVIFSLGRWDWDITTDIYEKYSPPPCGLSLSGVANPKLNDFPHKPATPWSTLDKGSNIYLKRKAFVKVP